MKLIADIGGTNVRFAIVNDKGDISENKNFKKEDFKNITDAINHYKSLIKNEITKAVIAVNTIVLDGRPFVNHNNWGYESKTIEKDTGIEEIIFINDLLAHASAMPYLDSRYKTKIYGNQESKEGPIIVIGPGTGLGLSYGIYDKNQKKHLFQPSEGGMQLVSSANKEHLDVIGKLLDKNKNMIWDILISGRGISNMYEALFKEEKSTELIMQELHEGNEKSKKIFDLFCEFLGVFVRNTANTFLSTGGIYIIGGILSRKENLEMFRKSNFINFYNYTLPEYSEYISNYPIYVVNHENPALIGLANY